MEISDEGRIICHARHPFKVLYANRAFTRMTMYEQHEIKDSSLEVLNGRLTDTAAIEKMNRNVLATGFGTAKVCQYTKDGRPIYNRITTSPIVSKNIYGEEIISHLLVRMFQIDVEDMEMSSKSKRKGRSSRKQEDSRKCRGRESAEDEEEGSQQSASSPRDSAEDSSSSNDQKLKRRTVSSRASSSELELTESNSASKEESRGSETVEVVA